MAGNQSGLDEGADAVLGRLSGGQELTYKAVGLECPDILIRDGANPEHGDILLPEEGIKGDVGGDSQLTAHIIAIDVGGWICLGVAQLLGLL